jgi:hypothetical protein
VRYEQKNNQLLAMAKEIDKICPEEGLQGIQLDSDPQTTEDNNGMMTV